MTWEEIDKIFPPGHSGNAQISDLRLLLSRLITNEHLGRIDYFEVQTIQDRDVLDPKQSDICKVYDAGAGLPETYIYDTINNNWDILVENTGGGGGPGISYPQTTENFTVTTLNQQAQSIDLIRTPRTVQHLFVFLNGMYMMLGNGYDYSLVGSSIVFTGATLTAGDHLAVKYSY